MHYVGLAGTSYMVKAGATAAELEAGQDQRIHLTIGMSLSDRVQAGRSERKRSHLGLGCCSRAAISVMCAAILCFSIALAIYDYKVCLEGRRL
jgi:hypothetical protein